jgi:hypothetical protein
MEGRCHAELSQRPVRPAPYGTVRPGAAIRRSDAVQPKASMVQQAAVGAASVIEYLSR